MTPTLRADSLRQTVLRTLGFFLFFVSFGYALHAKFAPSTRMQEHWKEYTFMQPVDHFNPNDGRMFSQKFAVVHDFYKPGGPMIYFFNGEGPLSTANIQYLMYEGEAGKLAKKLNALLVGREHRYFGSSFPFTQLTPKNLTYCTTTQSLADAARLQIYVERKFCSGPCKSIPIGGSYPGMLAAWYRIKYPHLTLAAWSSSAPLGLTTDNGYLYTETATKWLENNNPQCAHIVSQMYRQVNSMSATELGRAKLSTLLHLTAPITDESVGTFAIFSMFNVANAIQYGKGTIQCELIVNASSPLDAYAALWHRQFKNPANISAFIPSQQNLTADPNSVALTSRAWNWISCNEIPVFITSSPESYWPPQLDLDYWHNGFCAAIYGPHFSSGPNTNITIFQRYGAKDIQTTKTIFSNGAQDPITAWGITKPLGDTVIPIITDCGHGGSLSSFLCNTSTVFADRIEAEALLEAWIST